MESSNCEYINRIFPSCKTNGTFELNDTGSGDTESYMMPYYLYGSMPHKFIPSENNVELCKYCNERQAYFIHNN